MTNEDIIRNYVLRILLERGEEDEEGEDLPTTSGPGRGRFKKELEDLKALADVDPGKLMSNLKVSAPSGESEEKDMLSIIRAAVGGTSEMNNVYGTPKRQTDNYDKVGLAIPVTGKDMSVRDGLIFIRETLKGAKGAGFYKWDTPLQAEILGSSILVYPSQKSFKWNKKTRE